MKMFRQRWGWFAVCYLAALAFFAFGQEADSGQSLGDVARKLRKDTTNEVKMTDADTKKLFESVDTIFAFAAEDTGMPKHAAVKRRLVSKADVEKYAAGQMAKEEFAKRFAQQELSMKKLGFLPRDFNLKEFLVKSTGQEIAAYYDDETKTISMLDWVPPDRQEPILAHELTHALQDQNYDLAKWMKVGTKSGEGAATNDSAIARKAVVEGQAMVVYVDYLLKPVGRSLEDTPGVIYQMEEPAVKAVIDSQLMHDAPMILREAGTFAYNAGLIFEGELLHKGGKNMAFAGAFARPPRNSHEVLQPESYIQGEKLPTMAIPDMREALSNQYDVYDSGGIGELDVRALLKQYGERKIADDVASGWQGGAYVTFRRKDKAAEAQASTEDLALLYISRWKTPQAAERFAHFYAGAVAQRYRNAAAPVVPVCSGGICPVSAAQIATEEGPVIVEHWGDNSVIVSESFDTATAAKLRTTLRDGKDGERAQSAAQEGLWQEEIGLRLWEMPAFQVFAREAGERVAEGMSREMGR
jgi:hypothetical protein